MVVEYGSLFMKSIELQMNMLTILISLVAVVYWVKLFKRISFSSSEDSGWAWIFASVMMILILNLSSVLLLFSDANVELGFTKRFWLDIKTIGLFESVSRTIIAVSTTIGAYLLYDSIRAKGDVKFRFTALKPAVEEQSSVKAKYELKAGGSYFVEVEGPASAPAMELFSDLVKHGIQGLCITRTYPPKIREAYGLKKTLIVWLTKEKNVEEGLDPNSLIELSHLIREFISKSGNSVILLEGVEYLITQNRFEDVLRMIQSIDDVVVKNNSRFIVSADPTALGENHLHLLERELNQYKPVQ